MAAGSGRCLCGAVRFTVTEVETQYEICHCGMCRRWSGGPLFATRVDGVSFEDEASIERYRSSDWAERGFCGKCGTNLFYRYLPEDRYVMCIDVFDQPTGFEAIGEIFIDAKPAGYSIGGDLPKQTGAEFLAQFGEVPKP